MTNTNLLRDKIDKSGYKMKFVAAQIGLTRQGLLNKISNKSEFTASEIKKLCTLLNIDIDEKEVIFFCS